MIFESATDQPMENHLTRPEIGRRCRAASARTSVIPRPWDTRPITMPCSCPAATCCAWRRTPRRCGRSTTAALPAIVLSCVALMLAAAILSTLLTQALVQPVLNMTEDLDHIQDKVPVPGTDSLCGEHPCRPHPAGKQREDAAGFHRQCEPRAQDPADQHFRLCGTDRDRHRQAGGCARFCPEDPWRSQPHDPAGERYPAAVQLDNVSETVLHAGNGGRGPAGRGPRSVWSVRS